MAHVHKLRQRVHRNIELEYALQPSAQHVPLDGVDGGVKARLDACKTVEEQEHVYADHLKWLKLQQVELQRQVDVLYNLMMQSKFPL
jgi:hypothetical protein